MKVKINFHEGESIEYEVERIDISYDYRYVFITTDENECVAYSSNDVMNIEIEEKSIKIFTVEI